MRYVVGPEEFIRRIFLRLFTLFNFCELLNFLQVIPKMIQKLVFGCVGYATNLLPSLAPCACTMVARSRQKMCAAVLPNSQLLNAFRYRFVRKHRKSSKNHRKPSAKQYFRADYARALCLILGILAFATAGAAGKRPTFHGVQGSYEASNDTSTSALKPLIVIDAGHGGSDKGAEVNTFLEKKIALTTAMLTKKHLEELGYRVIMTRTRDIFLPLPRRVSIANKIKGSLFVSVHFNSSPSAEAQGIEVFYYDSKEMWRTRASKRLASCILYQTIDQTEAISRGVKQGNFHVIRETEMPAVLVEGGFMTNRDERAKLRERAYLDRLAVGIAQGIDKYMKM